jgi:hypothetical protein
MARRIALVEDDPTIRQNYADALTRAGYEVAAFGDRASAMANLAARLPELAMTTTAASPCAASCARRAHGCRSSSCRRATAISTSSRGCAWAPTTTSPRT